MLMNRTSYHLYTFLLLMLFSLLNNQQIYAQKIVYSFTIDQEIGPSMTKLTEKALAEAEKLSASFKNAPEPQAGSHIVSCSSQSL